MKITIGIISLLILSSLTAQQQELNDSLKAIKLKDSLKAIIHQQKGDTSEVNALFILSLPETLFDSARAKYARQGLALAQKIKYKRGEADCYFSLGFYHAFFNHQTEAIPFYFNALRIYTDLNDYQGIASVHISLYGTYEGVGDLNSSLSHLLTGLKIVENYKVRSLKMDRVSPDQVIQFYYGEIGYIYLKKNQLDSAQIYVQKALDRKYTANGSPWNFPFYLLGCVQRQKGDYTQALDLYRYAVQLAKQNQIFGDTLQVFGGMSTLFKMQGKPDSSIYYAQEVVQSKNPELQPLTYFEAVSNLAEGYKLTGDKDSALKYVENYHALKDSAYNIQKSREIQNFTFNEQLKNQEIISAQVKYRSKVQFYTALGGLLIMFFISGIFWNNNRNRKKAYSLLQNQKEETEIQKKRVEDALEELKITQAQLIQSEKMASLGELTAGIAHEIQNPLNFVNNFSDVNTELIEEAGRSMDEGNHEEAKNLLDTIRENEEKIRQHGQRADAIVKSMLQHSRTSSGQKEATDINALADEYLRLAYHGLRAKDKSFNAQIKTDFDESVGKINVIPQDIGRVLLNLYNNAFYAVMENKNMKADGFEPTVSVSSKKSGNKVQISVKDNGNGIPKNVMDKIFQPFFTTKPTGQGTGLGLSLSYDIIKAHHGEINVDSKEGEWTEFNIRLPFK